MTFQALDLVRDRATAFRFTSILGLQMGQSFPSSFIALFLPVIFREQGLPLDMYWVFTLPAVPAWLRPLWAPFVDRTGSVAFGMRKSWFLPCTVFGALAYGAMSLVAPSLDNLALIITLMVIAATIMTTQDIAIDGYMVENIGDEERPVAAAVLDVGRNLARFVAWAGLPWVYGVFGWNAALVTAAGLLLVFSLPAIVRAEPPRPVQFARQRPSLKRLLERPDSAYIFPMCFLVALTGGLIATLFPTYLSDLGFSVERLGLLFAPATLIGAIFGAVLCGWCLRRLGYRITMLLAAVGVLLAVIPIVWLGSLPAPSFLIVFLVSLNSLALTSLLDITFQAARLKWASKSQAATDYTTQVVTMLAGMSLATAIGGFLAEHLGWFYYFLAAGILISGTCFLLYGVFDRIEALVDLRDAREADVPLISIAAPESGDNYAPRRL